MVSVSTHIFSLAFCLSKTHTVFSDQRNQFHDSSIFSICSKIRKFLSVHHAVRYRNWLMHLTERVSKFWLALDRFFWIFFPMFEEASSGLELYVQLCTLCTHAANFASLWDHSLPWTYPQAYLAEHHYILLLCTLEHLLVTASHSVRENKGLALSYACHPWWRGWKARIEGRNLIILRGKKEKFSLECATETSSLSSRRFSFYQKSSIAYYRPGRIQVDIGDCPFSRAYVCLFRK